MKNFFELSGITAALFLSWKFFPASFFQLAKLPTEIVFFAAVTYLFSHIIRLVRLAVLVVESERSFRKLCEIYSFTALTGSLLPFKLGELFRLYGYSRHLGGVRVGLAVILAERACDATILAFLIMFGGMFSDWKEPLFVGIVPFLILFCLCIWSGYYLLPATFQYIRNLVLTCSATYRGVKVLEAVDMFETLHIDFTSLIRGRSYLLFLLSVVIWGLESLTITILFQGITFWNGIEKLAFSLTRIFMWNVGDYASPDSALMLIVLSLSLTGPAFFLECKNYKYLFVTKQPFYGKSSSLSFNRQYLLHRTTVVHKRQ